MALKKPKLPVQDGIGKVSTCIQLICFLLLFLIIYLPLRNVVHAWFLRILILLADYAVVSMVTYLVIRPAAEKIEAKFRNK